MLPFSSEPSANTPQVQAYVSPTIYQDGKDEQICPRYYEDFAILDPDEKEAYHKNQEVAVQVDRQKMPGVNTFNQRYTFDNFIVGNSNKYVYAACKGIAENPFSRINPYGLLALSILSTSKNIVPLVSKNPNLFPAKLNG